MPSHRCRILFRIPGLLNLSYRIRIRRPKSFKNKKRSHPWNLPFSSVFSIPVPKIIPAPAKFRLLHSFRNQAKNESRHLSEKELTRKTRPLCREQQPGPCLCYFCPQNPTLPALLPAFFEWLPVHNCPGAFFVPFPDFWHQSDRKSVVEGKSVN